MAILNLTGEGCCKALDFDRQNPNTVVGPSPQDLDS